MLWRKNGFIDAILDHQTSKDCTGLFISIYPHNKALKKWVERLARKSDFAQLSNDSPDVSEKMSQFHAIPELVSFNGVDQKIFWSHRPLESAPSNDVEKLLLNTISGVKN